VLCLGYCTTVIMQDFCVCWIGIAFAFHEGETQVSALRNSYADTLQTVKFREGNNGARR
jgi:hypothetical protein